MFIFTFLNPSFLFALFHFYTILGLHYFIHFLPYSFCRHIFIRARVSFCVSTFLRYFGFVGLYGFVIYFAISIFALVYFCISLFLDFFFIFASFNFHTLYFAIFIFTLFSFCIVLLFHRFIFTLFEIFFLHYSSGKTPNFAHFQPFFRTSNPRG